MRVIGIDYVDTYQSFRPLAGFWFLKYGMTSHHHITYYTRFRPLAGFWFLK